MKSVKIIASILEKIVKLVAIGYILTSLYTLVNCLFGGPFFEMLDKNRFAVNFPFSNQHFLLGTEYTFNYVAEMVIGIGVYGLFFWVLGNVFKAFKQERLFTKNGLAYLKQFYWFNLGLYPFIAIIWSMISIEDFPFVAMIIAHAIMGVFIYFLSAIFEQGVNLQNEQDLYI